MSRCRKRLSLPVCRSIVLLETQFGVRSCTNLSSTISRKRVVPKILVRAIHWLLIMVAVSGSKSCEAENGGGKSHLDSIGKRA